MKVTAFIFFSFKHGMIEMVIIMKKILIVEGYMDVISLHQRGITNVVAALGTALTQNQGWLLRRSAEQVILGFDSDGARTNSNFKVY